MHISTFGLLALAFFVVAAFTVSPVFVIGIALMAMQAARGH